MKNLVLIVLVGCGGGDAAPDAAHADGPVSDNWVQLPDVGLGAVQEIGVTAVEGRIYVVGGFLGGASPEVTATVQVYDPGSQEWSQAQPLPRALHHANVVGFDGQLYLLGSLGAGFAASGDSWVYSPQTDEWQELPPMPGGTERGASTIGVLNGRICVAGGFRQGMAVSDFSCFDPQTLAWDLTLPPLPSGLDHLVGGVVDEVFYAIGGRRGSVTALEGAVFAFDETVGDWERRADMVTARGGAAAGVLDGQIVVVGGEGNTAAATGVFPQVEAYVPAEDRWVDLGVMVTPRHGMGAVAVDDLLYVPGGATVQFFGATARFEAFRL